MRVSLRVGLDDRRFVSVVLHELRHVADSGWPYRGVGEREARAEQFSEVWAPVSLRELPRRR